MAPSNPNRREPIICAECGAENRPSRFFCGTCGAYLRGDEDTWEGDAVTSTYRSDPLPAEAESGSDPAWAPTGAPPSRSGPSEDDWLAWERGSTTRRAARHGGQTPTPEEPGAHRPLPAKNRPGGRRHGRGTGILAAVFLVVAVTALFALVYSALTSEPSGEVAEGDGTEISTPANPDETVDSGEPSGEAGGGSGEGQSETTTTLIAENPEPVSDAGVESSSELQSEKGLSYAPENLTDDDVATSWQEGATGSGEGEWIRFTFGSAVTLVRMEIANGYQKDQRLYEGNARPEQIRIEYSDGTSQMAQLQDEQGFQSVPLSPKGTESLTLTVESVYRGSLWEDMAISEIRFFEAAE